VRLRGPEACENTHEDLVKEVLDELFLQRTGGQETVQIRSKKFGDEIPDMKLTPHSTRGKLLTNLPRGI